MKVARMTSLNTRFRVTRQKHAFLLIRVVRPEGLELSTFWFVERQEGQSRKSI